MHARTTASPTGTQAVDRAARLVSEVVAAPESVTFTELATSTGLAKSTTSRLLVALERGGLVRRDDDGRFSPGEMFVRYAWRGDAEAGLVEVARPFLGRLGAVTGETINLGVAHDGHDGTGSPGSPGSPGSMVEQIAQVDSTYLIGGTNWVGRPVPLHCTALGKVLLAYGAAALPPGRLAARTPKTITGRGALEDDLRLVRDRGYAVTDGELEPGLVAVAAPVRRGGGAVVAAMSVSGPDSRLSAAQVPAVARACVSAADGLSAALGYRAAGPAPRRLGLDRKVPRDQGRATQAAVRLHAGRQPARGAAPDPGRA